MRFRHSISLCGKQLMMPLLMAWIALVLGDPGFADGEPQLKLVPSPASVTLKPGRMTLGGTVRIAASNPELLPLTHVLSDEIKTAYGIRCEAETKLGSTAAIMLRIDTALSAEAYHLEVGQSATVRGGSYSAVAYGTATLLQCMQKSGSHCAVPHLNIEDQPKYAYRGALIDLARKFHTVGGVKQVIDLCRLYKIRYLQLHLTDDQLFMFPSKRFPQLGKSNREFARFEPASAPAIKPYTREELEELEEYARVRSVALVPELDMPGHSGRMIADAPEVFGIPGNGSTVNIARKETVTALIGLLNEAMDIFKSTPYVHLGADEVGLGGLDQTPEYHELQKTNGIKSVHDLYCRFVSQMEAAVKARGKRAIVWEEAWSADSPYPLSKDTLVMVWSQGRNPQEIVQSGYDVVNATWTPLYIVRDNRKTLDFLHKWSVPQFGREGSTDFTQIQGDQYQKKLVGAQLCSWEDSEAIEIQSMRGRLALVAEKAWSSAPAGTISDFTARLESTDALLDRLVNPISMSLTSGGVRGENSFTAPLTIGLEARLPNLKIRYTLDNSLPNAGWLDYTKPFTIVKTAHLRAGLFDTSGKQHGNLLGSWFKAEIPAKPNLATFKPVTVGPSPDRVDGWFAKLAVDGKADDPNAHWASEGAAPQWLQVDLQQVLPINYINLITYWDGGRYYQWNAETSIDGKTWKQVLDFSKNTTPASAAGYSGKFPQTDARYVRINMLKNSANPYVHIVELIVERK